MSGYVDVHADWGVAKVVPAVVRASANAFMLGLYILIFWIMFEDTRAPPNPLEHLHLEPHSATNPDFIS